MSTYTKQSVVDPILILNLSILEFLPSIGCHSPSAYIRQLYALCARFINLQPFLTTAGEFSWVSRLKRDLPRYSRATIANCFLDTIGLKIFELTGFFYRAPSFIPTAPYPTVDLSPFEVTGPLSLNELIHRNLSYLKNTEYGGVIRYKVTGTPGTYHSENLLASESSISVLPDNHRFKI